MLAGGWGMSISRSASTWPVSMSATIHAGAGPSGGATLPMGCMSGSAAANGTTDRKTRLRHAAMTVKNLPMGPAALTLIA